MKIERLINMANQIASFFEAEADREEAMGDVANHLKKFWSLRMRQQLVDYVENEGGEGLSSIAAQAVRAHCESLCGTGGPILADERWVGAPGSSDAG